MRLNVIQLKPLLWATSLVFSVPSIAGQSEQQLQSPYFCGPDNPPQAQNLATIIPALYEVVSGRADEPKDWALLKQLHKSDAIITPVFHQGRQSQASVYDVDGFIALNKRFFQGEDFFETEVASRVFQYGHMATILSLYESRKSPEAAPYSKGINSFQLLNDGRRWCVISVTWDSDKGQHRQPSLVP